MHVGLVIPIGQFGYRNDPSLTCPYPPLRTIQESLNRDRQSAEFLLLALCHIPPQSWPQHLLATAINAGFMILNTAAW